MSVVERDGKETFSFTLLSTDYELHQVPVFLHREPDPLIFTKKDEIVFVVNTKDSPTTAFGSLQNNKFFGQIKYQNKTFFIEPSTDFDLNGPRGEAVLFSLGTV